MSENKKIHILNFAQQINPRFEDYLADSRFQVIGIEDLGENTPLDYIICSSFEESVELESRFNTLKNNIKIICLDSGLQLKNFFLSNGRLVLQDEFWESGIDSIILNKFFFEEMSIHLDEFLGEGQKDITGFKVINHLVTGEFVDDISLSAFENGFNLVSIRSFVDHLIYYYTYLKQSGLAAVPFEFEYTTYKGCFVVNVHANVKNFVAEYLIDSFGSMSANNPLNYLLGVVQRSCHFLDITYLEEYSKIAFTGYFLKQSEMSGVVLNNIKMSSQILSELNEKISKFSLQSDREQAQKKRQENLTNKSLPGGILEIASTLDEDSYLKDKPEEAKQILDFMVEKFSTDFPDKDISEFRKEDLNNFLPAFDNGRLVDELNPADKDFLVERIKKSNLLTAFDDEVIQARQSLKEDPKAIAALEETMGQKLATELSDKLSLNDINQLLKDKQKEDEKTEALGQESLFGEFEPSVPRFATDDAFEDIEVPSFQEENFDEQINLSDVIEDLDTDIRLSADPPIADEFEKVPGFEEENFEDMLTTVEGKYEEPEESSQLVKGDKEEKEAMFRVGGSEDDPEDATLVKGGKEAADDFVQVISSLKDEDKDDFIKVFSNSFSEEAKGKITHFTSSSDPKNHKNTMKLLVKSSLDLNDRMDDKVKAFLHREAPEKLLDKMNKFASDLGKPIAELEEEDFESFNSQELPKVLNNLLENKDAIEEFSKDLASADEYQIQDFPEENFKTKFIQKLENKLRSLDGLEEKDGEFFLSDNSQLSEDGVKQVIKELITESFEDEFKFGNASVEEIDAKSKQILSDLSNTLDLDPEALKSLVTQAANLVKDKEKELVADTIYSGGEQEEWQQETNSKSEAALISKLKLIEDENKKLKTNLSALQLQMSANDEVKRKFDAIDFDASEETPQEEVQNPDLSPALNEIEKKQVVQAIADGEQLSPELADKLKQSIERENKVMELARQAESQLKKVLHDSQKKDALFKVELTKAQKAVKAKEMVLDKAKESMKNLVSKKDQEILNYKKQINDFNQKLKNDQSTQLKSQLKKVSSENETLAKTAEVYKNKLESMAKNIEAQKKDDSSSQINEENRNLKRMKNQLENKLNVETKQKKSLEERYEKARQAELKARNQAQAASGELKTVQNQLRLLKDQNAKLVKSAASSGSLDSSKLSKELEQLKAKNQKLQSQLNEQRKTEIPEPQKPSLSKEDVAKMPADRLKGELEKSIKEVDHLKDQNHKLQEKIEELNKKYKDTPVVSPDATKVVEAQASKEAFEESKAKKEVEVMKAQNDQLQNKIKELVEKLKVADKANSEPSSTKEKRLDQSLKKLNNELTKARLEASDKKKEAMKYKAEVNGLKNQISKLTKDLEKAQKKGAGKKKAA